MFHPPMGGVPDVDGLAVARLDPETSSMDDPDLDLSPPSMSPAVLAAQVLLSLMSLACLVFAALLIGRAGEATGPGDVVGSAGGMMNLVTTVATVGIIGLGALISVPLMGFGHEIGRVIGAAGSGAAVFLCAVSLAAVLLSGPDLTESVAIDAVLPVAGVMLVPATVLVLLSLRMSSDWFHGHTAHRAALRRFGAI